jgi:hypothetical protein
MTCSACELLLGQDKRNDERNSEVEEHLRACPGCRALDRELAANALALESLRSDELPPVEIRVPRRRWPYGWVAAAAAIAALAIGTTIPRPQAPPVIAPAPPGPPPAPAKTRAEKPQPLKIKMLTPDPDVVIYWLIDN